MDIQERTTDALELSRHFNASPERVFDAWLGPQWGSWLGPAGATCEVVALDPAVGGTYHIRGALADGRAFETQGEYLEIDRPRRLVLTWAMCHNQQETRITVTFRPDGDGTVMTLRQDGLPEGDLRMGYETGWAGADASFDKLARRLAGTR
jgi:uncharacterized protein YndB with AHSA1/START domain